MSDDTMETVEHAINRSIAHDQIVYIAWSPEVAAQLRLLSDDSADASYDRGVLEFWGRSDDAERSSWRVHLRRVPLNHNDYVTADTVTDDQIRKLAAEAAEHGDEEMLTIITTATAHNGDPLLVDPGMRAEARAQCARVINMALP